MRSHQNAARATAEGRFEREIIPVAIKDDDGADTDEMVTADEGIRPDSSVEVLGNLKPAYRPENGRVTAGNSSQITDGASAVLIMSEAKANELGLTPRARFHSFAVVGSDPIKMLTGPIAATQISVPAATSAGASSRRTASHAIAPTLISRKTALQSAASTDERFSP